MVTVTGKEVIDALMAEQEFAEQPEAVLTVVTPYFKELPKVIADLLPKSASLATLTDAKLAFFRYASESGYITAVVNATPKEALGLLSREEYGPMMEGVFAEIIETLAGMLADIPALLNSNGTTEEQVMLGSKVGLSKDLRALYEAGELTISDIARHQPIIIVNNT